MAYVDFMTQLHTKTARTYMDRLVEDDKPSISEISKKYGFDYWDGERKYGYGGYHYDGRWKVVAEAMVERYGLKPGDRVLDIGCGKAYLLYELTQLVPGLIPAGIDISDYGIEHAKPEMKPYLQVGTAQNLPYQNETFDFVYSIITFHNLKVYDLFAALQHLERVKKKDGNAYICVESFRNERERVNMFAWQLTCESFYSTDEWEWIYNKCGYKGDHSFIFFE